MKAEFKITVELGDDVVLAPGVDGKFLSNELCMFTTKLLSFYTASDQEPEVSVSVPEIPPPKTKVTIV